MRYVKTVCLVVLTAFLAVGCSFTEPNGTYEEARAESDAGTDGESDTGSENDTSGSETTSNPVCGDGVKQAGEACDDGNSSNQDGCLNTCKVNSCGDGYVWAGAEFCDDGPANGTYGNCGERCLSRAGYCGDGEVQPDHEFCDDGDLNGTYDKCNDTCDDKAAYCGDGIVQESEEACDTDAAYCNDTCRIEAPTPLVILGKQANGYGVVKLDNYFSVELGSNDSHILSVEIPTEISRCGDRELDLILTEDGNERACNSFFRANDVSSQNLANYEVKWKLRHLNSSYSRGWKTVGVNSDYFFDDFHPTDVGKSGDPSELAGESWRLELVLEHSDTGKKFYYGAKYNPGCGQKVSASVGDEEVDGATKVCDFNVIDRNGSPTFGVNEVEDSFVNVVWGRQ